MQGGLDLRGQWAGGEQDKGISEHGNGLNEDCFQQGDEVADWMGKSEEVRNIPHEKEHTQGTHNLLAEDAIQPKAGHIGLRPDQEDEGTLQIEEEHDGNEQAGGGKGVVHMVLSG